MRNRKKSKRVSFGEARKITFSIILNSILPLVADALISKADIYKYNKFDGYSFSGIIIARPSQRWNQRCTIHGDQPAGPAGPRGDGRAGRYFRNDWAIRAVRVLPSRGDGPGEYRFSRSKAGSDGTRINMNGSGGAKNFCGGRSRTVQIIFRQMWLLCACSEQYILIHQLCLSNQ